MDPETNCDKRLQAHHDDHGSSEGSCVTPSRYCTDRAINFFLQKYCPKDDANILDVGCGAGYFPFVLKAGSRGKYLGVDIAPRESWSRDQGDHDGLQVDFLEYNAEELSSIGSTYNFIMSIQAMEHITNDSRAFLGMAECLEPGGSLFMTVPSRVSRATIYPLHGQRGYVGGDFRRFAQLANLELLEIARVGGLPSFLLHFFFWTIPFFGPIPISKRLLGRRIAFEPWKYYPTGLVNLVEAAAAATSRPSLGLEAGYAVVFRKRLSVS